MAKQKIEPLEEYSKDHVIREVEKFLKANDLEIDHIVFKKSHSHERMRTISRLIMAGVYHFKVCNGK